MFHETRQGRWIEARSAREGRIRLEMVDEERNKFLVDNAIEPFANETAESLYSLIESSAMVTEEMVKEFLKNHGGAV